MSYKPVMKTIGSKLRDLFSTSGQTVAKALPEEMSGGGSNIMLVGVNIDSDSGDAVLDKTWKEINDALASGTPVYVKYLQANELSTVCAVWPVLYTVTGVGGSCTVKFPKDGSGIGPWGAVDFIASSENDYPVGVRGASGGSDLFS